MLRLVEISKNAYVVHNIVAAELLFDKKISRQGAKTNSHDATFAYASLISLGLYVK